MSRSRHQLHVLGTGAGASRVYDGTCSTAFVLTRDEHPAVLIDIGLGVTRACRDRFQELPGTIVVTHNHTDHAGELPVVLRVESTRGRRMKVYAEQTVAHRLREHRLAEHREQCTPDELAEWHMPAAGERVRLGADLVIEFHPGRHSEASCGFLISREAAPLLAYTGDSAVDDSLYAFIAAAPLRVLDARPQPGDWHASFADIRTRLRAGDWIAGHGLEERDAPGDLPLLFPGRILELD